MSGAHFHWVLVGLQSREAQSWPTSVCLGTAAVGVGPAPHCAVPLNVKPAPCALLNKITRVNKDGEGVGCVEQWPLGPTTLSTSSSNTWKEAPRVTWGACFQGWRPQELLANALCVYSLPFTGGGGSRLLYAESGTQ